ncbi:Glutamate carboxypeptidase 2 [Bulinus truncatus]|nr:Glutamate carboxypeptidase 2 [Bulinus truncatus]
MNADELLVKRKKGSKKFVIGACVIGAMFFLVGILIGFFGHEGDQHSAPSTPPPERFDPTQFIIQSVDVKSLQNLIQNFSSKVRLAGTESNAELADIIKGMWLSSGLDKVHLSTYNVLLSFPNQSNPNKVELVNRTTGEILFSLKTYEPGLRAEDKNISVISYSAFSPPGNFMGDIVYVNYGTIEDFQFLATNLSLNLTNKIVMARSGKISSAKKVYNAEMYNSSGVILYSDPANVNAGSEDQGSETAYPDSWWLPKSGIQRDTVYINYGDPETPGYPSSNNAYHIENSKQVLPRIPCQPISYGDAIHLLRNLSGTVSPESWHGALPVDYKIGPGFENSEIAVKLTVNNYLDKRIVKNVIGIIKGSEEPDRYIILGNHHDAWVYGSTDPQAGNAALLQVVEIFGRLLAKGYRPRRTLIFCSWDASEPGFIGSTEWVEENLKIIKDRAVAYLNVDMLVQGNFTFEVITSPLLQDAIYTAAQQVPSPSKDFKTLYDLWLSHSKNGTSNKKEPSYLANVPLLPMKVTRFSAAVEYFITDLVQRYEEVWIQNNVNFEQLVSASMNFTEATINFENHLSTEKELDKQPIRLRMRNDQIFQLERAFLIPEGLLDQPHIKNIFFTQSNSELNKESFFPGIAEIMIQYNILRLGKEKNKTINIIKNITYYNSAFLLAFKLSNFHY